MMAKRLLWLFFFVVVIGQFQTYAQQTVKLNAHLSVNLPNEAEYIESSFEPDAEVQIVKFKLKNLLIVLPRGTIEPKPDYLVQEKKVNDILGKPKDFFNRDRYIDLGYDAKIETTSDRDVLLTHINSSEPGYERVVYFVCVFKKYNKSVRGSIFYPKSSEAGVDLLLKNLINSYRFDLE